MKLLHLRLLFDREKKVMMQVCHKRAKQKEFKTLYVQMAQFTEEKINCILQEYFALCVMIYRVKSKINYTWTVSHDIEDVISLFQTNEDFRSKQ